MSQGGVPDPNLRASDADRERIVEQLRKHTADGRLTMDEFEQRMTAAYAAKTYGELAQLTRDLPVDLGARSAGLPGNERRPPFAPPVASAPGAPNDIVNALVGAAVDWKVQRERMRAQRHQARLVRRANVPIVAGFAGWAFLSVLLVGIWFMTGITGGGFSDFWPIWPIGIIGVLTAARAVKTLVLRRDLTRR
ncbi:DUF1707 domain-containing protein [Actinocrinis puniceicyclus]|uniref:DUF1707 domain-containing protein n=1 Tax=Actinocrinis puniceicyclus TaxID=977794 RepID=A0A8J7WLE5_9ACTN|nr:DUF1707 domain-containing protein [Actinocrinis puniceicyclus]MBS2964513.1 DUF1707 domain-containing protein [Actinocrinis puniceicyclus]